MLRGKALVGARYLLLSVIVSSVFVGHVRLKQPDKQRQLSPCHSENNESTIDQNIVPSSTDMNEESKRLEANGSHQGSTTEMGIKSVRDEHPKTRVRYCTEAPAVIINATQDETRKFQHQMVDRSDTATNFAGRIGKCK